MMLINLTAPAIHAMKILKCIEEHEGELLSAKEIAEKIEIGTSYSMRVIHDLKRARLIESIQGRYGGFYLSKEADQISLYDVMTAMECRKLNVGLEEFDRVFFQLEDMIESQLKQKYLSEL